MCSMMAFSKKVAACTSLLFASQAIAETNGKWIPGECGTDGFCALIRVEQELTQQTPLRPSGVVVGTIDDDGFTVSRVASQGAKQVCRKEVRVPKVVYEAVTQMFNSVLTRGDNGALPASLTPAEQTMLLYYNTIMQQTMNFQCGR